jgi:ribosomal protein S18 acetylase RimI-like enzyme
MTITIEALSTERLGDVNRCDGVFRIDSRLKLSAEAGVIHYTVEQVPPYEKRYLVDAFEAADYIANPDRVIYLAYRDGQIAGQVRLCRYWNRYAYIEDLVVDASARREGIGQALMREAMAWAKTRGFPGIMLETQNNNVAACNLYERCGLTLAGFDICLYRGIDPENEEIALYWYLLF